ncbi:LuxR C-terminal-related transcriptional regulator [Cellulomonas sp. KRMCY2]|uniref:LuxR C-terminal-related transcriptional regulator n=1 Tax=Cellulomonas sp. KRMCY2 TaxID=1304865 RepID=UPI00045E7B49|nr:LuxR C-terminal-related transcriptional regulator [Cellulomonas sp. KRMCY2]
MAGPLLETKLHVPRRRRAQVARPRLSERLSRGWESTLTLVSAPAGFGKTTLLTQWLADLPADGRSVAWLSLDQRDDDPAVFWPYLVAALRTAVDGFGAGALALLESGQAPMATVLATLVNDLRSIPDDVVLVLDDYHVVEAGDVQEGMAFVLEHLPPQVHLVIATRADPALPLARLRGRGELVEVRAADLRFTSDEAATYLNEAMGLALTARDVEALEGRTEGWIAALQLAALSMQGRADVAGFIAGFAGDDRYIVDYLVEEVLQRQPAQFRDFLLRTSILSRLNGSLCDAVTGQGGAKAMLEALDRGNLFLVPLDDRRQWYRYHHLFADVLEARVLDEQPADVPGLHRRASHWSEQNGERSEAIRHAMAGGDVGRAADLVELAIPEMSQARQEATLRRWLEALPDDVLTVRPVLSVGYAAMLLVHGELEGVEARLRDAERWLGATAEAPEPRATGMVVVDEDAFRRLPCAVAVYRAAQAWVLGDVAGTMAHGGRALDLVGADDHLGRGAAAGMLGLAHWTSGDLEVAHRSWADSRASLQRAGHYSDMCGCAIALADIRIAQGRLHEAMSTYERGLQGVTGQAATGQGATGLRATEAAAPVLRGAADMHVGMSGVLCERNDLDAATQHLVTSSELGDHAGLPQNPHRWRVAMARIRAAEGDLAGAIALLDEAERLYNGDLFPDVRPIAAVRARVLAAHGRVGEALGWVRERGLSVDDDLEYLREFEHITLARVLLAEAPTERADRSVQDATRLLERLVRAADEGGRTGAVIEILVLTALAHQARRDVPAALAALRRALTLAEPEGYVRVFVDEGPPMAALLRTIAKEGSARTYVRRLLAAGSESVERAARHDGLIDPLSERERDVIRLLGTDLAGPEIARELHVSLNTVRTHTKSIYTKLGVTSRRAAVRRAQELHL